MYWEETGNPRGVPVVFLHGGPGGGSSPDHRRFYDPAHYRIIVYDQGVPASRRRWASCATTRHRC
jgi:hypothetical protein